MSSSKVWTQLKCVLGCFRVSKETRTQTRLCVGWVWVQPVGTKLHPHPHPSGQNPMGDPKPEPNCHPYTCRACMHRMFLLSLRSNAHDQTNIYGSLLYLSFFKSVCHMFCIKIEEEILQHQPQQQGQYMQHKANTNNHLTIHSTVQRTKPHALCHRGHLRALHCALPKVTCNVDAHLAKRPLPWRSPT
jgi:hypothetical protein